MDLYYTKLTAPEGKELIAPLEVTVFDENNNPVETTTEGATTYTFADEFELKDEGQEKTYTVAINWPDGENDIDYAGADFGTALAVSVTGTQK